jgi:hypothetical protein
MERFQRRSVSILNTVSDENFVIWLEAPPFATGLPFMRDTFQEEEMAAFGKEAVGGRPLRGRQAFGRPESESESVFRNSGLLTNVSLPDPAEGQPVTEGNPAGPTKADN